MAYPIESKLVIAVSSSALFNLGDADKVFKAEGEDAYRTYTLEHEHEPFPKGPAFSFVQRLLSVNNPKINFEPVEVILLSKNDADTGNRVFVSLKHYGLPISRAAFTCGRPPYQYISAFNSALFLSRDEADVKAAVDEGKPAGILLTASSLQTEESETDEELKIAFDFDGIIADHSSEKIYQTQGLDSFQSHEESHRNKPMPPGPLLPLLEKISNIQKVEFTKQKENPFYKPKVRTAIITARMAPAQSRVIQTLRHWGIHVDEAFFLGGISKAKVLEKYQPHIFFDDRRDNLVAPTVSMAMVHVPEAGD